ncbi:MAG: carboxylate--amine ligase [Clostridiales bacterium]|nr:MAG: carboxylate--amine ligase [Clostridiales bacterium]
MHKAVVLGANYFIGLGVIRRLGVKGVYVVACDYDAAAYGFKSKYIKEKLLTPHYRDESAAFLDFLIDYAKKQDEKPVLLPLQTSLLEKMPLAEHCRRHGVRIPETIGADAPDLVARVATEIGYPCIIKPVNSYDFVAKFRRKMFYVNSSEELLKAIEKAKAERLEVFVQRIIPGFDDCMYTYDAFLNEQSKVTHWATCQKFRQFPINFGASVYTMQRVVPELHDIGAPFLEAVGYKGFAEIEFKKDAKSGEFYLIEINARYTTLDVLIDKCGINMPYVTFRELVGDPLPPDHLKVDSGRYFWYAYEDILAVREYVKKGQLSVGQVAKSYLNKKAHAIWDIKDPKPFFAFTKKVLGKVAKRARRS